MGTESNQTSPAKSGFTGLPGLDGILENIRLGDNVVFQIDAIEDYLRFVEPFCIEANRQKRNLIYFRFADHPPVLPKGVEAHTFKLSPEQGFENFISEIFGVIERFGQEAFYVFDSLTGLSVDWYSDRMLGNFFKLTCPYLYDYRTVAYFAMLRNQHTTHATNAVHNTAQVVLDVYRDGEVFYLAPLKVEGRHSGTMYTLHRWQKDEFVPVISSAVVAQILTKIQQPWLGFALERRDYWSRMFAQASLPPVEERRAKSRPAPKAAAPAQLLGKLLRMAFSRDARLLGLAEEYLTLKDIAEIGKRMIGTGLIGGKAAGMLLARAILLKKSPRWASRLEPHDSFFIGSDVFYSYLIENKCWWVRRTLNTTETDPAAIEQAKTKMLQGQFPGDIENQFSEMLNYFGQSPIIVRSSSLLEDAYGNSFSGKYDSVFCANQGTPKERLEEFKRAVRTVYASTLSPEALAYRAHWGLLKQDEQMAILVQRVSGAAYERLFFPQIAGVGFSFNPYVWNSQINPSAGLLRLVFGLGTRAVDRVEDDYTRIIALNAPQLRPQSNQKDIGRFTQHKVDVLDLAENKLCSRSFEEVARQSPGLPLQIFASQDEDAQASARELNLTDAFTWVLSFEKLLTTTPFVNEMKSMLQTIEKAYSHPVDIEFTANFTGLRHYQINLLQCRPFQVKGNIRSSLRRRPVPEDRIVIRSDGPVIGSSVATTIDRVIYVVPGAYGRLNLSDRYAVARAVGRLTQLKFSETKPVVLLAGPGRWATSMPELGVPVSLPELHPVSILCEIAAMHEGLVPEVSLGTHFFNDLVETDMLYFAVNPQKSGTIFSGDFFENAPNALAQLSPADESWNSVIKVVEFGQAKTKRKLCLSSDVMKQHVVCYWETVKSK